MKNKKYKNSGHRQRMRERFFKNGFESFSHYEIIEFLLFYAIPVKNTNLIAHNLMDNYKDFYKIFESSVDELSRTDGITQNSAMFLKICSDICQYYSEKENYYKCTNNIDESIKNYLLNVDTEVFLIINIDDYKNIKGVYLIPFKTLVNKTISPRNIAEIILKNNIYKMIFAHKRIEKHPVPDVDDYIALNYMINSVLPLGTKVCDYLTSNDEVLFSMRKSGAFNFEQ